MTENNHRAQADAPAVSVLVPAYNAEEWILEAVESALAQTMADIEVVVVDDCSTDGTVDRLARIDDPRLAVRRNPKNLRFTGNVNRALSLARGRYVMVLGADDVLAPTFLERGLELLENDPALAGLHGAAIWIRSDGTPYERWEGEWPRRCSGADAFVRCFTDGFCLSTVLLRRDILVRAGGLPEHWGSISDSWLFLRMCLAGDVAFLDEALVRYRVHEESISLGMYADGSLFRDHVAVAREAFAWSEARALGLDRRRGEAMRGVVRNALRIVHLSRLGMSATQFVSLLGELATAAPGALASPGAAARVGFCALPRPAIRALRERRARARARRSESLGDEWAASER